MNARIAFAAAVAAFIADADVSVVRAETGDKRIGILLAAGDISTCGNNKWHRYANRTAELIQKVIKDREDPSIPVRVLALGDLAYERGKAREFVCFGKRWADFESELLPVPGNHEYQSRDATHYFKHFKNNPYVNQNIGKGYFALNFPRADGPWYLIGLNDNFEQNRRYRKEMDAQMTWLEERLTEDGRSQNCVLAFWHRPTFTGMITSQTGINLSRRAGPCGRPSRCSTATALPSS
jgi:hypothetical protein